ncbi:response regulator transcription factor [Pedobacter sp. SD-b]|uniref:Response regulator transcription factor n=1 Tax=Pedobacter segetis TaxID=2793069 RepID=A0ABS1BN45_9SPHI|nr:LytTR family DNA-binding domain-containing protein [Pedobacter segetis]MBK0384318.1 response regulator transcription factor [Pedobacter segetis]
MTKTLSCIAIDDDALDLLALRNEICTNANLNLLASFNNCFDLKDFLDHHQPEVVFMDIEMQEINGLDFIKALSGIKSQFVLVSSHPEYAIEGFQLNVFDYILKPIESDRLNSCVQRLMDFLDLRDKAACYDLYFENENIVFKEGHAIVKLNVNEIFYLEAFGDYTKIITLNKNYLTLNPLSKLLESLPLGKFLRIHRSFIVAINKVKSLGNKVIDIGLIKVPVGKTYLKEAKQMFK